MFSTKKGSGKKTVLGMEIVALSRLFLWWQAMEQPASVTRSARLAVRLLTSALTRAATFLLVQAENPADCLEFIHTPPLQEVMPEAITVF